MSNESRRESVGGIPVGGALPPMYDPEAVRPMWEELEFVGVRQLANAEEVDKLIGEEGTALVVVNSVCGCAAGSCRPGVALALQHKTIPDRLATVFAGVTRESVQRTRERMKGVPPSSPAIALFKDGKLAFLLERHHIEQMSPEMVADSMRQAFDAHCSAEGPSISEEKFKTYQHVHQCGSNVPLWGQ